MKQSLSSQKVTAYRFFHHRPGPETCAEQLGGVLQILFQRSMDTSTVPQLWKHSTVILIPKKSNINDLRPVALTSLTMKAMKRVVKQHGNRRYSMPGWTHCSMHTAQAEAWTMQKHSSLTPYTNICSNQIQTARLLFADFSAFNTLQTHILANKLTSYFQIDDQLNRWILDFLTNRSQRVQVNNISSDLQHLDRLTSTLC